MWSRPAAGKVWTPLDPAALRPASRAAALTCWLDAWGWSPRPSNQITASRAIRASTATPDQSRVGWRRPLAAVPAPEPRPGWLLPVGAGLDLGLRVSAIDALRVVGRRYRAILAGYRSVA